tara:strand:- start:1241 stop:1450 length:210 start_codon:yes stop_codon:yes gene_type:complete
MLSRFNILLLFLPMAVLGQNKLTEQQILQDHVVLKNVLSKGHPSLYEYTSKSKWGGLFTNFEENKNKDN